MALGVVAGGLFEFFGTLGLGLGALEVREILFVADGLSGGAEGIPVAPDPLGLLQDARIHHPADPQINAAVEHIPVPAGQAQAEGAIGCFGGQGILLLVAHLFAGHGDGFQRPQHPHLVVGVDLGGVVRVQFSQLRVHGGGTVGLGLLAQLLPQDRGGVLRFKRYTF